MTDDAYKRAGVDIDAGDDLVKRIAPMAKATAREGVVGGLGGFGGLFALGSQYEDPILVSGTDGVGTKLLVAQQAGDHGTIGIDLVAMCVNDIIVTGAEPLFFLDYFATGKLDVEAAAQVVQGIADGCKISGCALLGGETAEMPGMYAPGHYDLAGFAVGVVERSAVLDHDLVQPGDRILGLASSGVHSNGYSLVRHTLLDSGAFQLSDTVDGLDGTLADELLKPTTIYVQEVKHLIAQFGAKAAAHITGGGIPGNLPRCLPTGCGAAIYRQAWDVPFIFELIQRTGDVSQPDMDRTFNLGIGMCVIVPAEQAQQAAAAVGGRIIGEVVSGDGVTYADGLPS